MSIYRAAFSLPSLCCKNILPALILPSRNTYIVKRKYPPPLSKLNARQPRILKAKHFVYETVEDTDLTDPPDLHIVLTTFVEGVGDVGDVISLIPEYARNHFLLPQKAVYATPENIAKYASLKKNRPAKAEFSSIHVGLTLRTLSKCVIPVFMNHTEPWSVERNHIHYAFRSEEYFVPEDCIEVPSNSISGPDPDKEGKDFAVYVTINNREKVPVRCRLFHIRPGLETTQLPEENYLDKNEPILEDQRELLDEMPMPEIMNDPSKNVSLAEKYGIQYIK